jgi:hypothetical protein
VEAGRRNQITDFRKTEAEYSSLGNWTTESPDNRIESLREIRFFTHAILRGLLPSRAMRDRKNRARRANQRVACVNVAAD